MATVTECEYCGADDVVLYGWHADVWCRSCAEEYPSMRLIGSFDDAPLGRPERAPGPPSMDDYAQPYVIQTPDGSVVDGRRSEAWRP